MRRWSKGTTELLQRWGCRRCRGAEEVLLRVQRIRVQQRSFRCGAEVVQKQKLVQGQRRWCRGGTEVVVQWCSGAGEWLQRFRVLQR